MDEMKKMSPMLQSEEDKLILGLFSLAACIAMVVIALICLCVICYLIYLCCFCCYSRRTRRPRKSCHVEECQSSNTVYYAVPLNVLQLSKT